MKSLTVLLIFVTCCSAFPVGTLRETDEGDDSLTGGTPQSRSFTTSASPNKTGRMQDFFDVEITGRPDEKNTDGMQKPKCGFIDVGEFSFFSGKPVWKKRNLTYRILNYTKNMAKDEVDWAIQRAFKIWSDVTSFTFTRINNSVSDIEISFVSRAHNDSYPFDGPSNKLAHAFRPSNGDVHFDNDETWTNGSHDENLFLVAAHEFGHSLGLHHSNDSKAVMFGHYQYVNPTTLQLSKDDIDAIQSLYGVQKKPVPPTLNPESNCLPNITFDAVTTMNGSMLFFKDGHFWRKTPQNTKVERFSISSFWPFLTSGIQAAYEYPKNNQVFFFKKTKYWALKDYKIEKNYPKNISELGLPRTVKRVDAAVHDEEAGKTYFFINGKYWSFDEQKKQMDKRYPRKIITGFPGIGNKVQAAFKYKGLLYFSNGNQQYEYSMKKKNVTNVLKNMSWFNCKSENGWNSTSIE
ncbi:matrix metalloproteinase-18 [Xenopus laevis]|nr:matrix metalloproteinase-18 [Xenopus laevis]